MTTEDPTPEAIEVANAIGVAPYGYRRVALALDAWGAALLKRQEQPDETRLRVEVEHGYRMSRERDKWRARFVEEKDAHEATRDSDNQVLADCFDQLKAAEAAHEATKAELVQAREALVQIQDAYSASRMGAYWRDKYRASQAELESRRKPLEGELAWDAKRVREYLLLPPEAEPETLEAFTRIEAALRAKGEPQAVGHIGSTLDVERMARTGEVAATEPPEPRPIVVGSNWRWHDSQSVDTVIAVVPREPYVRARLPSGEETSVAESLFREEHNWLNDPEPATPAPDLSRKVEHPMVGGYPLQPGPSDCVNCGSPTCYLGWAWSKKCCPDCTCKKPRKVEPGTALTVGARYRITAISTDDSCPANQVGDVVIGFPKDSGMPAGAVFVNWDGDGYWFAKGVGLSGGTYVTGLELVAEAGEGE